VFAIDIPEVSREIAHLCTTASLARP
jgi:hypothetical protein